ncbi:MAG: hypothetical protein HY288_08845 [Planctomycetia bacterium]|nr:hypothetical protein [Planctomycetia bacterium]
MSSFALGQQPPAVGKAAKPAASREELEKQFAETLSGATLVGHFTITGQNSDQPLKEERYTLGKVSKLKNGDFWSFQARIQYGDHDVNVPLALEVKWSGDTPVITLTDVAIPGLGTYTARVLFYRDQYAGTWSGGGHGGHLFGKVVKETAEAKADDKASEK